MKNIDEKAKSINQLIAERRDINTKIQKKVDELTDDIEIILKRELPIYIDVENDVGINVNQTSVTIAIYRQSYPINVITTLERIFGKCDVQIADNETYIYFKFDELGVII